MNLVISLNEILFFIHVWLQFSLVRLYLSCVLTNQFLQENCRPEWINMASHIIMIILSNAHERRKRTFLIGLGRLILHFYLYIDTVSIVRKYEIRIIILYLEIVYFTMMSTLMLFGNSPTWVYDLSNCWEETAVVVLASLYFFTVIFNFEISDECGIFVTINILLLMTWKIYQTPRPRRLNPYVVAYLRWVTTMTELTLNFMDMNLNDRPE